MSACYLPELRLPLDDSGRPLQWWILQPDEEYCCWCFPWRRPSVPESTLVLNLLYSLNKIYSNIVDNISASSEMSFVSTHNHLVLKELRLANENKISASIAHTRQWEHENTRAWEHESASVSCWAARMAIYILQHPTIWGLRSPLRGHVSNKKWQHSAKGLSIVPY